MGRVTNRELYGECFLYYYILATDTRSFLVTFSLGGWVPCKSVRDRSFSPYIVLFSTRGEIRQNYFRK